MTSVDLPENHHIHIQPSLVLGVALNEVNPGSSKVGYYYHRAACTAVRCAKTQCRRHT